MKRLLLPVMAPVMIAGVIALVIGSASAGAHTASRAHGAKAATIQLKKVGDLGKVLVNGHGQTLYLFEKDKHGKSACYGQCAKFWPPPLTHGGPVARGGAKQLLLRTTRRANDSQQVTYAGHLLYRFVRDRKAGQTTGEGSLPFGAGWDALSPAGKKIESDDR